MKSILWISVVFAVITGGSLYFPYFEYDVFEYEMYYIYQTSRHLISQDNVVRGFEVYLFYIPVLTTFFLTPFILVNRTVRLASFGRTIGVLLAVYMGILMMMLETSPSYYNDYENVDLQPAFYVSITASFIYMIALTLNAAMVKRWPDENDKIDPRLLDNLED